MEFYDAEASLPHIPDNISLSRFILEYRHEIQPARGNTPCLIDDSTGRQITLEELRERTSMLANALHSEFNLGNKDVVMLVGPNHIDYPVALWAVHKLGGIVTCSNPQFTPDELSYQLSTAKVTLMIVHSTALELAVTAARLSALPSDRIIVFDDHLPSPPRPKRWTVPGLIHLGLKEDQGPVERTFSAGEGKSKIALLCWSSGTTGKPKAVAISHHALIANIIQMATHNQVDRPLVLRDGRSYRPGDVALGVLPFYHVAGLVIGLHLTMFCAMTLVVVSKYDFDDMLNSIISHNITHLLLV